MDGVKMDGTVFREKREAIEKIYCQIGDLIDKKDFKGAKKCLNDTSKLITKLSDKVEGNEIQERAIFNLQIKRDNFNKTVESKSSK